eukprot:scpid75300/ scgid16144/ 
MADNRITTPARTLPRHASHQQDLLVALQAGTFALEVLNRPSQAQKLWALSGGLMSVLNALKKFASAIEEGASTQKTTAIQCCTTEATTHGNSRSCRCPGCRQGRKGTPDGRNRHSRRQRRQSSLCRSRDAEPGVILCL